jgi:uncharacterized repeat protein (TIGR03803 family)
MKFRAMTNSSPRNRQTFYSKQLNAVLTACALVIALAMVVPETAFAQTFSMIYQFPGGPLGASPWAGMVMGRDGNLYGTTFTGGAGPCPGYFGGPTGCGTVFRFNPSTGRYTVLYQFTGGTDGGSPAAPLLIAPDGTLYGSTVGGGEAGCVGELPEPGCGVVFHLQPRATPPRNVLENYWVETPIYTFGGSDGNGPLGDLATDQSGDIYGSTAGGGSENQGVVFKLTPSNGAWTESILHNFIGGRDGASPNGVTLGPAGNVYGTTEDGGGGSCFNGSACGTVYQLLAGSGWAENLLYSFTGGSDGGNPASGVTFDSSGNLYSSTSFGGSKNGGTVFELSGGSWAFQLLHTFTGMAGVGPELSDLVFDRAGNLYGTTLHDGVSDAGSVFKLTPSMGGGHTYTSLHDFCAEDSPPCPDGVMPSGTLVMDSSGNLYGTTQWGGSNSGFCNTDESIGYCGVIFKITP